MTGSGSWRVKLHPEQPGTFRVADYRLGQAPIPADIEQLNQQLTPLTD